MALAQQDYEQIGIYVKQHIVEWIPNLGPTITFDMQLRDRMTRLEEAIQHNTERTFDLTERSVRVEEELKHQRELMQQGFEQVDKRFEQVDKRFDRMQFFLYWVAGIGFTFASAITGLLFKLAIVPK